MAWAEDKVFGIKANLVRSSLAKKAVRTRSLLDGLNELIVALEARPGVDWLPSYNSEMYWNYLNEMGKGLADAERPFNMLKGELANLGIRTSKPIDATPEEQIVDE